MLFFHGEKKVVLKHTLNHHRLFLIIIASEFECKLNRDFSFFGATSKAWEPDSCKKTHKVEPKSKTFCRLQVFKGSVEENHISRYVLAVNNQVSYLIQSARKRAHLCAMLRPASKKHTRTISINLIRVFASKPSFPSLMLITGHRMYSLFLEYITYRDIWSTCSFLLQALGFGKPAGSIGEHAG